jgi:hypothetical protein
MGCRANQSRRAGQGRHFLHSSEATGSCNAATQYRFLEIARIFNAGFWLVPDAFQESGRLQCSQASLACPVGHAQPLQAFFLRLPTRFVFVVLPWALCRAD